MIDERKGLLEEFCKHLEAEGGGLIDETEIEGVIESFESFLKTRPQESTAQEELDPAIQEAEGEGQPRALDLRVGGVHRQLRGLPH